MTSPADMPYVSDQRARLNIHAFDPGPTLQEVVDLSFIDAQAAKPLTRQTFHVNIEECPNVPLLKKTLDAWKPTAVLLLGNQNAPNNLGRDLMAQVSQWNGIGIYRPFESREGNLWTQRSPGAHVNWLLSMDLPENCWVNVGNEPVPDEQTARAKMCPWYATFADIAFDEGLNVIVPGGFASGAFGLDAVGPQTMDAAQLAGVPELTAQMVTDGWFDTLLRAIAKYAAHRHRGYSRVMFGAHTYAHGLLPWHTAGRDVNALMHAGAIQKVFWPTKAMIFDGDESDNWLVLRENWLLNRMRKLENDPLLNVDVAITECWWDRMPNIVQQYPQVAAFIDNKAGREVRGLKTLRGYFGWAFPQWTFAQAVCEQLLWAESVYPAHYRTFVNFAWTGNGLWQAQYDWSELNEVLEEWPKMMIPPIDIPESPPETVVVTLLHGANGIMLRADKTPASELLIEIKPGETVGYELPTQTGALVQGNDQWLHVYHSAVVRWGWVSAYYFQLPAFEEPPEKPVDPKEPPDDPPPPPIDDEPVTMANVRDMIAQAEVRITEYHALKLEVLTDKLNAQAAHIAVLEALLATMPQRTIQEVTRRLLETEASQSLSKAS